MGRIGLLKIGFIMTLVLTLSSCMSVATSGVQAVYNRHTISKNLSDQYATIRAYRAIFLTSDEFSNTNISISTFNGEMLVVGQVLTRRQKFKIERILKRIPHVTKVYNMLTVSTPTASLVKMSDTWITTKVKSQLIASNDVDATQIKVVTENGTVYLMGVLPPAEAREAVYIASHTVGVQRVVKVFSYLRVSKQP